MSRVQAQALVLVMGLAVALATGGAVAQSSSPVNDVLADDEEGIGLDVVRALVSGLQDRLPAVVDVAPVFGEEDRPTATESADNAQAALNNRSGAFEDYINSRSTATTGYDVLKMTFKTDSETATRYLTADVSNGNYSSLSMDDSTSRTVDEECTLSGQAARNAGDEIRTFDEEFVKPDADVIRAYLAERAGKYGGIGPLSTSKVSCSFVFGGS